MHPFSTSTGCDLDERWAGMNAKITAGLAALVVLLYPYRGSTTASKVVATEANPIIPSARLGSDSRPYFNPGKIAYPGVAVHRAIDL